MNDLTSCGSNLFTVNPRDLRCCDSILRVASQPFVRNAGKIADIVERLRQVLNDIPYGTGLSAIQIGIPLRIAIVNIKRSQDSELLLLNPEVVSLTGRPTFRMEGCLSLPHFKGRVKRKDKILVKTCNLDWQEITIRCTGYEAAVVQHELDHMDGLLYWDRMEVGLIPEPL
jgi:peptide deformylase